MFKLFALSNLSKNLLLATLLTIGGWQAEAEACTGIVRKAEDGSVIYARTLEFGADLLSFNLLVSPRGYSYSRADQKNSSESVWQNKYGYVGFAPFGLPVVADGLNERGLSAGAFYMPGYAEFEKVPDAEQAKSISNVEFVSWVLGNFATVEELKKALKDTKVFGAVLPQWGFVPPLHFVVTDAAGASIVVEYIDSKQKIHDNAFGVLTNSPNYDWHTTNVRNYIGLSTLTHPAIEVNRQKLESFGQGSGAIGLPGDFSPPARFIRAVFLSNAAVKGKEAPNAISMAFKILNSFDIPEGAIRSEEQGKAAKDITQWTSAADLKNRKYYFHTYNNRNVRMVDLNKIPLDGKELATLEVTQPEKIEDLSSQFQQK